MENILFFFKNQLKFLLILILLTISISSVSLASSLPEISDPKTIHIIYKQLLVQAVNPQEKLSLQQVRALVDSLKRLTRPSTQPPREVVNQIEELLNSRVRELQNKLNQICSELNDILKEAKSGNTFAKEQEQVPNGYKDYATVVIAQIDILKQLERLWPLRGLYGVVFGHEIEDHGRIWLNGFKSLEESDTSPYKARSKAEIIRQIWEEKSYQYRNILINYLEIYISLSQSDAAIHYYPQEAHIDEPTFLQRWLAEEATRFPEINEEQ